MGAFSVSDLLNPERKKIDDISLSLPASMDESAHPSAEDSMFAPELFEAQPDSESLIQSIDPMVTEVAQPLMLHDETTSYPDPSMLNGLESYSETVDSTTEGNEIRSTSPVSHKKPGHGKSTKRRDSDPKLKDTKHSSKNEGQHTDRRYLCYLCHKLFTRRRSVRDHLSKIHGEKTWEPTKSLEIEVEPHSGEPIEPLEALIARGPPPPSAKSDKDRKSKRDIKEEYDEDGDDDEEQEPTRASASEEVKEPIVEKPPASTSAMPKLKAESSIPESRVASTEPVIVPAPVIGKKRPLPVTKKGIAKTKSASKRPRLAESETSTPTRSPGSTPAHKASQQARFKRLAESPIASSRASSRDVSPSPSSSDAESVASTNDDGEVFCICRKGDNHTWMIACDGPCEEWYHGKCVNIRERDGDLIDKYICPRCTRDGYVTTWKRMCRYKDCRKPAQVLKVPPSKYCSVECGRKFFIELVQRGDSNAETSRDRQRIMKPPTAKKTKRVPLKAKIRDRDHDTPLLNDSRAHTPAYSDDERSGYETDSSLDDEQLPNRGGPLRVGEVKAILQKCQTIEAWRSLGKKPDTPPQENDGAEFLELQYDDYQKERVEMIKKESEELQYKDELLTARETLLDLIKARSASITDEVKKGNPKLKELCGYDPRLSWSEAEFARWYESGGKQTLESGKIGPPEDDLQMSNGGHEASASDEDLKTATTAAAITKGGVCIKNRCQKHGSNKWQRAQLAELRFEQDIVKKGQDKLEMQEKEIRDIAVLRAWEVRAVD